ncbi:glycosyltransferase [Halorubrum ezzemoulense]|uniref:glycosyltransferase n=1 Tax=Halorubrum ezzemoulense TaxID=337243 RepID=UPI00232C2EA4|nr:glycosyltransferase [Halorubrum ezzemoulense]MDB9247866.1 glycosyltransferase [Halorubrum ezzemoulense]MDB9252009.1 glycosyltransferase [Halorubrum ezzemoulense]MDB9254643.1 glycosyltransferase [Halorubrum ezzemoulense]MDB9258225.1 glycosyltransferase [Halorubrum ezzemoulense]MDB9261413.1 glycosyltransferase [Halorubrum ezzemoulense]
MSSIRYSICATHYNNGEYIRNSAGVFADEIEGRNDWELVITDAGSTDGSIKYLRDLESRQENVRVIVEEGLTIGEGRRAAAEAANGDILIQVMDLDANYYNDGRILDITCFYENLIEEEGELMLSVGINFCTSNLLQELGGWSELITNEETELKRRALRVDKLRFAPIRVFDQNAGLEKGLRDGIVRFYHNSAAKFQAGVSFWYMLYHWARYAPGIKPKIGAFLVFPFSWISAKRAVGDVDHSYDKTDKYLIDFKKTVYKRRPELWLDPPETLSEYVDEKEIEHIRS